MSATTEIAKRRFSPEIRRSMILDSAAEMVDHEGISQVSMERVAQYADISKSLIYKYFDNITEIMRELLDRELSALRQAQFSAAEEAGTFEDMVRGVTKVYLRHIQKRGSLVEQLLSDPTIAGLADVAVQGRETAAEYFAKIVQEHFYIPMETAHAVTHLSFGVPVAAGSYLLHQNADIDELEDITVSMIIGTINGARDEYMIRKRPLQL